MPRNSSGVYQLPAGNPVVTGTLIESAWANSTMSDMAQAMTDSLDRFGRSTMAAPLLINDGTVSAPGVAFGAESSTGIFRKSAKILAIAAGGIEVAEFTQAGIALPLGIVGSLTGKGSTNGSWSVGPYNANGGMALTAGSPTASIMDLNVVPADGTSDASVRLFRTTNTTGKCAFLILRGNDSGTADHRFTAGATGLVAELARNGGRTLIGTPTDNTIDTLQIALNARIRQGVSGVGTPTTPAALAGYDEFVIEGSSGVGMSFLSPATSTCGIAWGDPGGLSQGFINYNHSSDRMALGAAGANSLTLDAVFTQTANPLYAPDGTAAAPSYAFTSQPTWGIFRVPALGIGLTFSGTEMVRFLAAGMQFSSGQSVISHSDTTSLLGIAAAPALNDGSARIELYDVSHATLARYLTLRGKSIVFTDSTAANEKARTSQNAWGEIAINTIAFGAWSLANRGLLAIDGSAGSLVGLSFGGATRGSLVARTGSISLNAVTGQPLLFEYNGTEVARVDTDSTLQYGGIEVGYRDVPLIAAPLQRGKCVSTAVGITIPTPPPGTGAGAGSMYAVYNSAGAAITLTAAGGLTLRLAGTGTSGNRTLQTKGYCTIFYITTTEAIVMGNVS